MKYVLAWIGCGILGVVVDLVRHQRDMKRECAAGGHWTIAEVLFLLLGAILGGPWILLSPLMNLMKRGAT